jgi:hypothetical protein
VLPPATAVYHDQVVQVVSTNCFLKEYLSLHIGLAECLSCFCRPPRCLL